MIAKWVTAARRGNEERNDERSSSRTAKKECRRADLIVNTGVVVTPAVPIGGANSAWCDGYQDDRYVSSVEGQRSQRHSGGADGTVGGTLLFHHMTYESVAQGEAYRRSIRSVGNGRHSRVGETPTLPNEAGRLLKRFTMALSATRAFEGRERGLISSSVPVIPGWYKPRISAQHCVSGTASSRTSRPIRETRAAS